MVNQRPSQPTQRFVAQGFFGIRKHPDDLLGVQRLNVLVVYDIDVVVPGDEISAQGPPIDSGDRQNDCDQNQKFDAIRMDSVRAMYVWSRQFWR